MTRSMVALLMLLAAPAMATELKAGIHQQCLKDRAEGTEPAPDAWMALGQLDQVRGDLKAAFDKYRKAFELGADVTTAQLDFTYANGVIWIQSDACPVPVPPLAQSALMSGLADVSLPELTYPPILLNTQSPGTVRARAWVDGKGAVSRIAVTEASAGLPQIRRRSDLNVDSTNRPGVEAAERMVARVQFALTAIDNLRGMEFGRKVRGKMFESKIAFRVPDDMAVDLPGAGLNTGIPGVSTNPTSGK